jgi:glycosyltransferase involved in cell wall biosynthesis
MSSSQLCSVIITTYYRNSDLKRAIKSVRRQTYEPIEVIVIDDSGEAYAQEVVSEFDVEYIAKDQNEGQMAAWNTGIEHCNGKHVQFLDDDDQLTPSKIEKQIKLLRSQNEVGVTYCGFNWESGGSNDPTMHGEVLPEVLTLNTSPCITSTMLIRFDSIKPITPLPIYTAATDDVLKIELAQNTKFEFIDERLVIRGEGDDNVSGSTEKINAWYKIIDEYSQLYNQQPPNVKKRAHSHILHIKTRHHLGQNRLSIMARLSILYSIIIYPGVDRSKIATLLQSLGGRPAVVLGKTVESIFR